MAERTIHLQGIGRVPAVEAQDLRPGMILSWNDAPAEFKVISVRPLSSQYVELTEASRVTGEVFRRRLKKTRLVGASWPRGHAGDRARRRRSGRDDAARDAPTLNPAAENALRWIGKTGGLRGYGMAPNHVASQRLVRLGLAHENPSRPGQYRLTEKGRIAYEFYRGSGRKTSSDRSRGRRARARRY